MKLPPSGIDLRDTPITAAAQTLHILKELVGTKIRPFVEGEQIGAWPGPPPAPKPMSPAVARALHFAEFVEHRNSEIIRFKSGAKMLVLDVDQRRLIEEWRKQ